MSVAATSCCQVGTASAGACRARRRRAETTGVGVNDRRAFCAGRWQGAPLSLIIGNGCRSPLALLLASVSLFVCVDCAYLCVLVWVLIF